MQGDQEGSIKSFNWKDFDSLHKLDEATSTT